VGTAVAGNAASTGFGLLDGLAGGNGFPVIFLPIAERELRVAARKRRTFWIRAAAALVAVLIGAAFMTILEISQVGAASFGRALFGTLTWMSLFAALSAGLFFTSDCLSEEKREGTLGFLFLTDLRGYDVAAGKLLATSLRGSCAVLAVFPILAVTMLMGGITGGQFWKTVLALANALFCSLSAGLMVSAVSRDSQKAMGGTLLALLALAAGGPLADLLLIKKRLLSSPLFSLSSPFHVFQSAGAWGPTSYWKALLASNLVGWVFFAAACALVPRAWQEKGPRAASRSGWVHFLKYGGPRRRAALRRNLLESNPILWMASRERWQTFGVLFIVLSLAIPLTLLITSMVPVNSMMWGYVFRLGLVPIYLWTASQAARLFNEGRRNGLIELLLTTPVSAEGMVRGQWRALVRMFGLPVVLLVAVQLFGNWFAAQSGGGFAAITGGSWVSVLTSALAATVTAANLIALTWVGMWMGLTSRSGHIATLKAVVFVLLIPWMVIWFVSTIGVFALLAPLMTASGNASAGNWIGLAYPIVQTLLSLAKDYCFYLWAKNQLQFSFRSAATRSITPVVMAPPRIARPPVPAPPVIPVGA